MRNRPEHKLLFMAAQRNAAGSMDQGRGDKHHRRCVKHVDDLPPTFGYSVKHERAAVRIPWALGKAVAEYCR
jgi:hypothetical protein